MNNPLENLTIDNNLDETERNIIKNLNMESFGATDLIDFQKKLKEIKINVKIGESNEEKQLGVIANSFNDYVEKGDGWKLTIKDDKSNNAPERIKNMVENPYNNDLAFLIQKISNMIGYQTARMYGNEETKIDKITEDAILGNQTLRALDGLKNLVLSEKGDIKYISEEGLKEAISMRTKEQANNLLSNYNLKLENDKIVPKDSYEFINPYSNNLSVRPISQKIEGGIGHNVLNESQVRASEPNDTSNRARVDTYKNTLFEAKKERLLNEIEKSDIDKTIFLLGEKHNVEFDFKNIEGKILTLKVVYKKKTFTQNFELKNIDFDKKKFEQEELKKYLRSFENYVSLRIKSHQRGKESKT